MLDYLLDVLNIPANEIVVVCNRNDRGVNSWQRSLRYTAKHRGVSECLLEDAYDVPQLLFLSLEFDRIVKPELFASERLYNLHFSLLPKYKGMYTAAMPILNDESESGVTLHEIHHGIDTGDIVRQSRFALEPDDTSRDLYLKCIEAGTRLVEDSLPDLLAAPGKVTAFPQPPEHSSYYSKSAIDYENVSIDLRRTAQEVRNQVRAFNFREYQIPIIFGHKIVFCEMTKNHSTGKPGSIIFELGDRLVVSTVDYDVVLFFDRFDDVMAYCRDGDLQALMGVRGLSRYVNEKDGRGWTPLMVAVYNGWRAVAELLISEGANPHEVNKNGTSLLMYAKDAFVRTGDSSLFNMVVERGVDPDRPDYSGKSLSDYCAEQGLRKVGNYIIDESGLLPMRA